MVGPYSQSGVHAQIQKILSRGPTLTTFFVVVDEGREDPYTTKRRQHGPVSETHLKCFSLEG